MRFTKIRLVGLTNVDFPLVGASTTDKFILKSVDGLGAPETDREVTLNIKLNPSYSAGERPSDLRTELYGMCTPGYGGAFKLQFLNDDELVVEAGGYIKRIEPNIFASEPEVQMVLGCDFFFTAPQIVTLFEDDIVEIELLNAGTAPAGFIMRVDIGPNLPIEGLIIYDELEQKRMAIEGYGFLTGDLVTFNTVEGQKNVTRTRAGATIPLLNWLANDFQWFKLHGGLNKFKIDSEDADWTGSLYGSRITYSPQHWGL